MSLNAVLNSLKTTGYYAVEVTKNLFSEVDTTSHVAGLTSLCLKTLEDNKVITGYKSLARAGEMVRDWAQATKLPGRAYEVISGRATTRDFFGQFNLPKVISRLCLAVNDFFNSVRFLVDWGGISKSTGTFLTFGLKDTSCIPLSDVSFGLGIGGWGADLIDAASRLYEEGPSIEGVITVTQDVAKLASLTIGRFAVMPRFVKIGVDGIVLVLALLKSVVKTYSIQLPVWLGSRPRPNGDTPPPVQV